MLFPLLKRDVKLRYANFFVGKFRVDHTLEQPVVYLSFWKRAYSIYMTKCQKVCMKRGHSRSEKK